MLVLDEIQEPEWICVKTGVKQDDVTSGFLFLTVVDGITRNITEG